MLNRYDFDMYSGNMVKNNQRFAFQDMLDLESVLSGGSAANEDSKRRPLSQTNNDAVNQYHLHSILVHRGTLDSGHYFAFIRPGIQDRWYEFNDEDVTEVTKAYAIG